MTDIDFSHKISEFNYAQIPVFSDKIMPIPLEEKTCSYSSEKQICSVCKEKIGSEISKIIIMSDVDGGRRLFFFHFFFPCWDFKLLCQNYPKLTIDSAGFSIPENISIKEKTMKRMQNNIELWT